MSTNGTIRVSITEGPLAAVNQTKFGLLIYPGAGALICFEGIVRPSEADRPIEGIRYEAYEPMAQETLYKLLENTIEEFGVLAVTVEHSKGMVPNLMCSFRMQVASTHRKEGLAAMDWFIDAMKSDVPIWKHQVWSDEPSTTEEVSNA